MTSSKSVTLGHIASAVPQLFARAPSLPGWQEVPAPPLSGKVLAVRAWTRKGAVVISALEQAELPDKSGEGPQWHLSVSYKGKRPRDTDVRATLRAFDMRNAEEDNHHPGIARHFWLPVDPAHRVDCECKEDEEVITEPDGYRWTNPRPGDGPCRGCEMERLQGRPCPIHKKLTRAKSL